MNKRGDQLEQTAAFSAEEPFCGAARRPDPSHRREFIRQVFDTPSAADWEPLPDLLHEAALGAGVCVRPDQRAALGRLVFHLDHLAPRLLDAPEERYDTGFLIGLVWLAELSERWVRPIETWNPEPDGAEAQFSALLRHLLARYAVPDVMDSVFSGRYRELRPVWFWHVGTGGNLRTAEGFPVPLTSKMAHHTLQAPPDLDLIRAIRRGQVLGFGGSEELAESVGGTGLGRRLGAREEETWWASVIHWLVNHPELQAWQHGPLVDYLDQRRRNQSDFCLKGRSPRALWDRMRDWHRELNRRQKAREVKAAKRPGFPASGHVGGKWEIGSGEERTTWTMAEIRNAEALREEGRWMHHCVANYVQHVSNGHSSIWSLAVQRAGASGPALTVQVDQRARAVIQARGSYNRLPTREERDILILWATRNKLKVQNV